MFKLNEAPNTVLAAISCHKVSRTCGTFWSILCCIPSFGGTLGACDDVPNPKRRGCCFPKAVNSNSDVTLAVLIDRLNALRFNSAALKKENLDEHRVIEDQVRATIALVGAAIGSNMIEGTYKEMLELTLRKIQTQATQEQSLGHVADNELTALTRKPYVPSYTPRNK